MYEDEVHQIECRWVPSRDHSPIATSFPGDLAQQWFDLLRGVVWPHQPNPASGVPESSVVYLMLENRMAALVWRQWAIDAISLEGTGGRRPLVTRILVGNQQVLGPETALALCCAGLHSLSVPPLGQVAPGTQLSPIEAGKLSALATEATYSLDDTARRELGLHRLISTALRDRCTPLSVQLPPEEIGEPGKGAQVPFLWGLWRTTALLFAGADAAQGKERSWSFSTYEPPFQGTQTTGLADLVFRVQQLAAAPAIVRSETTVLPRSPVLPSDTDDYDELAIGLAEAYRTLGATELAHRLESATGPADYIDRLNGACRVITEFVPARQVAAPENIGAEAVSQPKNRSLPDPGSAVSGQPDEFGLTAEMVAAREIAEAARAAEEARVAEEARRDAEAVHAAETARRDAETARAAEEARRDAETARAAEEARRDAETARAAEEARRDAETARAAEAARRDAGDAEGIINVIDLLTAGPAEPGFERALGVLHGRMPRPSPQDRADARQVLAQREWCIPGLATFDPWRVEYTLEALFRQAVMPDLATPACQGEVASWVYEAMAPTAVVRSLVAAAHQAGQDQAQMLDGALQPALHRRWLVEHAIYSGTSPQTSAERIRWTDKRERPPWQIIVAGPRSAAIASILAWVCLALIIALVFSLAS
jgi:hypothetical protein